MTIYALSSGPGLSGVAVIRISGSETEKVIFADDVVANQFKAGINKKGDYLSVNSKATIDGAHLKYSREKNHLHDINIINSSNITYFVNKAHNNKISWYQIIISRFSKCLRNIENQ